MGQRHQLFVIARINGKYRCLAAVHHQWLYGKTALYRCLGTLRIFQAPANRIPLQEEIKMARNREEALWKDGLETDTSSYVKEVPFPFIMTCLNIGASFDAPEGYYHQVHVEDFHMAYDEGDNNNGITIFDVSDPSQVRYCFVDFYGMESTRTVPLNTPLDGHAYLAAYYEYESHDEMVKLVKELSEWPLVQTSALKDTWPDGPWEESDKVAPKHGEASKASHEDLEMDHLVDSLRAQSLNNLVQTIVEGDDLEEGVLTEVEILANFWPVLQFEFYKKADTIRFTERKLELLSNSLQSCENVDLSPFGTMESHYIIELVEKLSHRGKMKSLNLSGLRQLSKSDLKRLLDCGRSLRQFYILDDISLRVADLAEAKSSCEIYQHVLLKEYFSEQQDLSAHNIQSNTQVPPVLDFSLEGEVQPILHLACVGISKEFLSYEPAYNSEGNLNWYHIIDITRAPVPGSMVWCPGTFCRKVPMIGTPLPLRRLTVGLQNLLQWSYAGDHHLDDSMFVTAAISFALGRTKSSYPEVGIGPITSGLYGPSATHQLRESRLLQKGQFAILLIHNLYDTTHRSEPESLDRLREVMKNAGSNGKWDPEHNYYAIVTPHATEDSYVVYDMPTFLESREGDEAKRLAQYWRENVEGEYYCRFYDPPDIQDLLKNVYMSDEDPNSSEQDQASEKSHTQRA